MLYFSKLQRNFQKQGSVRYLEETSELRRAELPIDHFSCITLFSLSLSPINPCIDLAGAFNATALYMWRSNVLKLRNVSSTWTFRHGVNARWYSSGKSLPINEKEFEDALRKVLPWQWNTESKTPLGMRDLIQPEATADCSTQVSQSAAESIPWRLLLYMPEPRKPMNSCRKLTAS